MSYKFISIKQLLPSICSLVLFNYSLGFCANSIQPTNEADSSNKARLLSAELFTQYNNDNPILSTLRDYEDRKQDDHGLTFGIKVAFNSQIALSNNSSLEITFNYFQGLYTKNLGTTTKLTPSNNDYSYFEYIAKKHPDWDGVYLYDQTSLSKYVNRLSLSYKKKWTQFGLSLGSIYIDADVDQKMADLQIKFHKTLGAINYYYKPFTASNMFDGTPRSYFTLTPNIKLHQKFYLNAKKVILAASIGGGYSKNIRVVSPIPKGSPFYDINTSLSFLNTKLNTTKRIIWYNRLFIEPNEILPLEADPGSKGFYTSGVKMNFNFWSKKDSYYTFFIVPYELSIPIMPSANNVIYYDRPSNDKGIITSIIYLGISRNLK